MHGPTEEQRGTTWRRTSWYTRTAHSRLAISRLSEFFPGGKAGSSGGMLQPGCQHLLQINVESEVNARLWVGPEEVQIEHLSEADPAREPDELRRLSAARRSRRQLEILRVEDDRLEKTRCSVSAGLRGGSKGRVRRRTWIDLMRGSFSHSASLSARTLAACHRSGSARSCSSLYCSSGVPSPTFFDPAGAPAADAAEPVAAPGDERARGEREKCMLSSARHRTMRRRASHVRSTSVAREASHSVWKASSSARKLQVAILPVRDEWQ